MRLPFTISDESLTVFANGKMNTIRSSHPNFDQVLEHLRGEEHDPQVVYDLCNVEQSVRNQINQSGAAEKVEVTFGTVYYEGQPIHNSVTERLLSLLDKGIDVTPWVKFLENLMENPSYRSRECLYNFLEHFNAPLTEDGCFLAFKRVTENFKDLHTRTFDNSPGTVVTMPRHMVDDDPSRTCSAGLHVAADEYLKGYATGSTTILVKVNPRDVVAVPYDYNFSKMRCCQYEVLQQIDSVEEYLNLDIWYDELEEFLDEVENGLGLDDWS